MAKLTLQLDFPSGSWLGDVSRTRPDATLRATETISTDDTEVTALDIAGSDRAATVEALREHDRVDRVEVIDHPAPGTRARVVASAPLPHVAAARTVGLPIEESVAVIDGCASLSVVGDRSRLTAFGRRLTEAGVEVAIEASDADEAPVLTDAQRELVLDAVAAGYYDTPRECTLTELATAHGIAKSTCSETLHRAEGRVLRRFVAGDLDSRREDQRDRAADTTEPAANDTTVSAGDADRETSHDPTESAEAATTES